MKFRLCGACVVTTEVSLHNAAVIGEEAGHSSCDWTFRLLGCSTCFEAQEAS